MTFRVLLEPTDEISRPEPRTIDAVNVMIVGRGDFLDFVDMEYRLIERIAGQRVKAWALFP